MDRGGQPKTPVALLVNEKVGLATRLTDQSQVDCNICEQTASAMGGYYFSGAAYSTTFLCPTCFEGFPAMLTLRNRTGSSVVCDLCGRPAATDAPQMYNEENFDICPECYRSESTPRKFVKIHDPAQFINVDDSLIRAFPEIRCDALPPWVTIPMIVSLSWLVDRYRHLCVLPSPQWNAMACVVVQSSNEAHQRYTKVGMVCLVACLSIPGCPVALMHRMRPISMDAWMIGPQLFGTHEEYREHAAQWRARRSIEEWRALAKESDAAPPEKSDGSDFCKLAAKAETDFVTHLYLSVRGMVPDGHRH